MHAPTSRTATARLGLLAVLSAGLIAALAPGAATAATPGTLDSGFGSGGIAGGGGNVRLFGAVVQSDGKVLAVGQSGIASGATLVVERFTTSGALDGSFGSGGVAHGPAVTTALGTGSVGRSVAIQSDGKIVVVGKATDSPASGTDGILVERFNSNGSIDSSFGSHGVVTALGDQLADGYGVAIQSDGKIIAAGSADANGQGGFTPRVAVIRLNSNGSLDSSFASHGVDVIDLGAYSVAQAVALQRDGKIVIAGSQAPGLQVPNALIARLTTSGKLDPSFGTGGAYAHQYARGASNSAFNALAVQRDGKIVAAGAATAGNTGADAFIARFNTNGSTDGSFGGGVVYKTAAVNTVISTVVPGATGVTVTGNGDIVAAGTASNGGLTELALWAVKSNGATETGFGSGGQTITSLGASTRADGNGLAIAPDGKLVLAGDLRRNPIGAYSGMVARYNGLGAPPPPPTSALKVSLSGLSKLYKTSTVAKQGLTVGVNCNESCTFRATLTLSSGTAKQLHIKSTFRRCKKVHGKTRCKTVHGYRSITLGSHSGRLSGSGTSKFTLRLNRKYVKALERAKSFNATLHVTATANHKNKTATKVLVFKR